MDRIQSLHNVLLLICELSMHAQYGESKSRLMKLASVASLIDWNI